MYWGENIARVKSNHIFPVEYNLFCDNIWAEYFNWGKIYDIFSPCLYFSPCVFIFSPCVFIFSLLGHAINCSTFAGGVLGENILCLCFSPWPCCMVFICPFLPRQLLGYELEEKQYNIFPPGPVFFLLVTEKLIKQLMGERKMVFFSHFHIFPPWTMLYLVPLLRQLRYRGAWKWWYLPLA